MNCWESFSVSVWREYSGVKKPGAIYTRKSKPAAVHIVRERIKQRNWAFAFDHVSLPFCFATGSRTNHQAKGTTEREMRAQVAAVNPNALAAKNPPSGPPNNTHPFATTYSAELSLPVAP